MKCLISRKYDGYHFSKRMSDVFNPFSILKCFSNCNTSLSCRYVASTLCRS